MRRRSLFTVSLLLSHASNDLIFLVELNHQDVLCSFFGLYVVLLSAFSIYLTYAILTP